MSNGANSNIVAHERMYNAEEMKLVSKINVAQNSNSNKLLQYARFHNASNDCREAA